MIASFLCDCGITDLEKIGKVTPRSNTLKIITTEEAVDTILLERESMNTTALTLLCDKGEGESKRDGASFVKLVARWSSYLNHIHVLCIGIHGAGNTSISGAAGVNHALKPYDIDDNNKVQFSH